ncbi:MAG: asparagine synthase (glutamine-hydrolyzing) [Phycisphaerae bacterium]
MCGICGMIDFSAQAADLEARLPAMIQTLRHRGPDQEGTYADDHVGLGHARLSIIDVTDGRQPLSNEDGTVWIAYNGEIYNFKDLRAELRAKGHQFRTETDTEVIVHLFEETGIECVNRLRGMFAFAIWDGRCQSLYLVRDRLGIKPLYWTVLNRRLLFGSEIKAILAHRDVPRAVRADALSDYLTFLYVPAPKTMFRDIFKLEPGHWLRFDANGIHRQQYWDLEPAEPLNLTEAELHQSIIRRLAESVGMRLVSDVPLGAFLSGGVDSSSVVAMMAQAGQDPLVTVSVGFDDARYDELPFAARVAERYQTRHHEERVQPEATRIVERLAWHYDEPFADYSSVPTYYVSAAARKHVTVTLSGDGGDENFAGYRRYRLDLFERSLRRLIPAVCRRWAIGPLGRVYPKADWLPRPLRAKVTLKNVATDPASAYCRSVGFLDDDDKHHFLNPDADALLGNYQSAEIIRGYMSRGERSGLNQLLYTDIKSYLVDDILTKVDRASMAVSLEVRVPLLDHEFVEFVHRIPPEMKLAGSQGKRVFKTALEPYLDRETLYRPKQGFTPPIREWFRNELRDMAGDLLVGRGRRYSDYISQGAVQKAWDQHQSGRRDYTPLLWAVLMFELWNRTFL